MKHDTVAWSLQVGDQRYIYVVHGRRFAMKHGDAGWVVGSYSSEASAHDSAVKATAGHGSRGKITEGPVSFTMDPARAKMLREGGVVDSTASLLITAHLATEKAT